MIFKHSGSLGDIIYSLPAIASQGNGHTLLLQPNQPANFYVGCRHPAGDKKMNDAGANFLLPLLAQQSYLKEVAIFDYNTKIDIDLDDVRRCGINYQNGDIAHWYFYIVKGHYDTSEPWLEAPSNTRAYVAVNRTSRYSDPNLNYKALEGLMDILFVGLEDEYNAFKKDCPSAVWKQTADAYELAKVINSAIFFVGNNSLAMSIAEGLKVPRVKETVMWANNVIMSGGLYYDAIRQENFDWAVKDCMLKALASYSARGKL